MLSSFNIWLINIVVGLILIILLFFIVGFILGTIELIREENIKEKTKRFTFKNKEKK